MPARMPRHLHVCAGCLWMQRRASDLELELRLVVSRRVGGLWDSNSGPVDEEMLLSTQSSL